jgi:hypothetical protein
MARSDPTVSRVLWIISPGSAGVLSEAPFVILEEVDPPHVTAENIDRLVAAHFLNF